MKYLLKLSYCGTDFAGFQVQPNADTVQAALMRAAEKIFTVPCKITGCSRTDSGVHALEYFATLEPGEGGASIAAEKLPRALGSVLPESIAVMAAKTVADDFSVRRAVSGKEYFYVIWTQPYGNPFLAQRAWQYKKPLDIAKMNEAAKYIVGRQDFASFMASGSDIEDTVRCVTRCEAVQDADGTVRIYVAADGFLYNMVRIIVGTLVGASEGKMEPAELAAVIAAKDRKRAGRTAPPDGLYLNKVFIDF